jgi:hypothetical protein
VGFKKCCIYDERAGNVGSNITVSVVNVREKMGTLKRTNMRQTVKMLNRA